MRIDRIELRLIALRLHEPFRISSGTTWDRRILIVRMEGEGVVAWGECVADETPHYAYETVDTARLVIETWLAPAILGRTFESAAAVAAALERAVRGHPMARAALEMAAWDLEARVRGTSLAALLGAVRPAVPSGVSIGIQQSLPELVDRVRRYVEEGYRRIKIKIAPGWDIEPVARIRDRFPDTPLMVDANSAYTLADADHLARLDTFGLTMIEQPLGVDDLLDHALLQRRLATPICLDECISSPARCAEAIHLGSGRIVNIKPGRVGGHAASLRIHHMCAEAGIPVWCGGMLESGIGRAHNVALAALPGFTLPGDTSASRRYWARDVIDPGFILEDGCLPVPTGPGIGVDVDAPFLAARSEWTRTLTA